MKRLFISYEGIFIAAPIRRSIQLLNRRRMSRSTIGRFGSARGRWRKAAGSGALVHLIGRERFFEYISRFGFGRKTGVELPGESRGIVNPLEDWRIDSIGSVAIGQEVSVTLLPIVAAKTPCTAGPETVPAKA